MNAMTGEKLLVISAFLIISVSGAALHESCLKNEQCGTFDTYCKDGICVCKENFTVIADTCVQLATPPIGCKSRKDCHSKLGSKSTCPKNAPSHCACKSFHHLHNNQCIKSRSLDDFCEFDEQCYCGADCNDKIECANKTCACKPGFKQDSRRCIISLDTRITTTNNSVDLPTYSATLLITILFFVKIL